MPLPAVCIVGLRRKKFRGYAATQIEMGTWIHTSLGSLVAILAGGGTDAFVLIWSPAYRLAAADAVRHTWTIRDRFD